MAVSIGMIAKRDFSLVGDLFVDHVLTGFEAWPNPGEEVFATSYFREVGGGAANTACSLAKLGRSASLFGIIGEEDSQWVHQRLYTFGVDIGAVAETGERTGLTVSLSTPDDRTLFSFWGANRQLSKYMVAPHIVEDMVRSSHVHFALPIEHGVALELFPRLREAGCTISLDVGWQTSWLMDSRNRDVLRLVDYFLPNEREAQLLTGHSHVPEILAACVELGIPSTVIKLGAHGAAMLDNGIYIEASPPEAIVSDTTGAGDAFNAGFLDAALDGVSVQDRLRRGCVCGALSTRATGALAALPDRAELLSYI